MGLHTIPTTDLFNAFAQTLGVGYDYMTLCFDFFGGGLGTCSALTISHITYLTGWLGKPFLHPVQGPFEVLSMS